MKKGVSAIIATVLIVMISVFAVAILWQFIIPNVKENLKQSTAERVQLSIETTGGYTTWDEVQKIARVQVKRGNDNVTLTGMDFSFVREGSSVKRNSTDIPQKNEIKIYEFKLSELTGKPEKVLVAPITASGVGAVVSQTTTLNNYSGNESIPQTISVTGASDNLVQDIEHSSVTVKGGVYTYYGMSAGRPSYIYMMDEGYIIRFSGTNWTITEDSYPWDINENTFFLPPTDGWKKQTSWPPQIRRDTPSSFSLTFHASPDAPLSSNFNGDYVYNASQDKWLKGTSYEIYKDGTTWKMTDGTINYLAVSSRSLPPRSLNYSINGIFVSEATLSY